MFKTEIVSQKQCSCDNFEKCVAKGPVISFSDCTVDVSKYDSRCDLIDYVETTPYSCIECKSEPADGCNCKTIAGSTKDGWCVSNAECSMPPKNKCKDTTTLLQYRDEGKCIAYCTSKETECSCDYDSMAVSIPCGTSRVACWDGSVITKQRECVGAEGYGAFCIGSADPSACPSCPTADTDKACQSYGYDYSVWGSPFIILGCGYSSSSWGCCGCEGGDTITL